MNELTTTELATILRALDREERAARDKRRKLRPSVRALMLVDVERVRVKVAAELERRMNA